MGNKNVQACVELFERLRSLDNKTRDIIIGSLPREDLETISKIETVHAIKILLQLPERGQQSYIDNVNNDRVLALANCIREEIVDYRINVAEKLNGSIVLDWDLSPQVVNYFNSIVPDNNLNNDEDYGGDEQGALTFKMDGPKVLSLYQRLVNRLGISLTKSLMCQAEEYRMAIENRRAARYEEMIAEDENARSHGRG